MQIINLLAYNPLAHRFLGQRCSIVGSLDCGIVEMSHSSKINFTFLIFNMIKNIFRIPCIFSLPFPL